MNALTNLDAVSEALLQVDYVIGPLVRRRRLLEVERNLLASLKAARAHLVEAERHARRRADCGRSA